MRASPLRRDEAMLAIGTNVAVRYLVKDDPVQSAAARRVIDKGEVLISDTVWLETDWVLRGAYGFSRAQVCKALQTFAGLPNVVAERPDRLARALS